MQGTKEPDVECLSKCLETADDVGKYINLGKETYISWMLLKRLKKKVVGHDIQKLVSGQKWTMESKKEATEMEVQGGR